MILTEVYGVVTVYAGSVDTEFTASDSKKEDISKGDSFLEHKLYEEKILKYHVHL